MKLAFSNAVCPEWDLNTLLDRAKQYGYDGVELWSLPNRANLAAAPELTADPAAVKQRAADTGASIICLASDAAFYMPHPRELAENQAVVREYVELAAKLGCPMVRVRAGELPPARCFGREHRNTVLARIAQALREVAEDAAEHGVSLVIENGGDFADSASVWYLVDAVGSPAVRCCWNPLAARAVGELPTRSIPRLAARIGLVRVSDAKLSGDGAAESCVLPGQSDTDVRTLVQLLKGVGYRGYLVVDSPRGVKAAPASAEVALPAAAVYLRQLLGEQPVQLSAYKGDKNKPRQGYEFAAR